MIELPSGGRVAHLPVELVPIVRPPVVLVLVPVVDDRRARGNASQIRSRGLFHRPAVVQQRSGHVAQADIERRLKVDPRLREPDEGGNQRSIEGHQRPSHRATRGDRRPPEAIGGHQRSIRGAAYGSASSAWKEGTPGSLAPDEGGNQSSSDLMREAIKAHQGSLAPREAKRTMR